MSGNEDGYEADNESSVSASASASPAPARRVPLEPEELQKALQDLHLEGNNTSKSRDEVDAPQWPEASSEEEDSEVRELTRNLMSTSQVKHVPAWKTPPPPPLTNAQRAEAEAMEAELIKSMPSNPPSLKKRPFWNTSSDENTPQQAEQDRRIVRPKPNVQRPRKM